MSSPLLEDNNITGAKHILVNITSGTKEVTMDEIFAITEFVQEEAGDSANLIWGNCYDDTLGDKLSVTVIATGFESRTQNPLAENKNNDQKVVLTLDDEPIRKDKKPDFFGFGFDNTEGSIELESSKFSKPRPAYNQTTNDIFSRQEEPISEEDRRRRLAQEASRREKLRTTVNSMKLNNPQTVVELENEPAYMRRGVRLDSIQHSSERNLSNWSIDENDELKTNNSYLHDNVD